MRQVTQQNATAGHPGDHGANLLAKAEALCRAIAGRDLGETPLYIVAQSALPPGYRYGLSHASLYLEALGDEPARCAGMLFRDIKSLKPPPAFSSLWCDDFIAHHQRFPLQKGSAP